MKDYNDRIKRGAAYLQRRLGNAPSAAIVLGSGLGDGIEKSPSEIEIRFGEIPSLPDLELTGHPRLIRVDPSEPGVCLVLGRYHTYERLAAEEVVLPVAMLAEWGVKNFMLSNAAAALNDAFSVGELMLVRDHIGLFMENPLVYPGSGEGSPAFTDMTAAYDKDLREKAREEASELELTLREGTYLALPGPSFETPAEIRFLRKMDVDAVGMSTVPEVIALRRLGRRVLGISCLTNYGAGMQENAVSHTEVVAVARGAGMRLLTLLKGVVSRLEGD